MKTSRGKSVKFFEKYNYKWTIIKTDLNNTVLQKSLPYKT